MSKYADFSHAWFDQAFQIREFGRARTPRGLPTLERRWTQLEVADPLSFPVAADGREFRDVIGVLEGLSLVGQCSIPELFTSRVKNFANFTDDGMFHGAYGIRAYGHLGDLCSLLKRDPDTRQAVLSIYDSDQDLGPAKRDVPCTLSLHFMLDGRPSKSEPHPDDPRDESERAFDAAYYPAELDLKVTMRSNDVWLGTPYDFTQFAMLQAAVAQAIGAVPGRYIHSTGSLHLYDRDRAALAQVATPSGGDSWVFPLFASDDEDMAGISRRARHLLLDPKGFTAQTGFETWAQALLLQG